MISLFHLLSTFMLFFTILSIVGCSGPGEEEEEASPPLSVSKLQSINSANQEGYQFSGKCLGEDVLINYTFSQAAPGATGSTATGETALTTAPEDQTGSVACQEEAWTITGVNLSDFNEGDVTLTVSFGDYNAPPITIKKDIQIPTFDLSIRAGHVRESLALAGNCSEDGTVTVSVGNFFTGEVVCKKNEWALETISFDGEDDGEYTVSLGFKDLAGNPAQGRTENVIKDTIPPNLSLDSADSLGAINSLNQDNYSIGGDCEDGGQLTVEANSLPLLHGSRPVCDGNRWQATLPPGLPEGAVTIAIGHSDQAGNQALQVQGRTVKDTVAANFVDTVEFTPGNGLHDSGTPLSFTVNFNEAVVVEGTPRLHLTFDSGAIKYADYDQVLSDPQIVTFTYVIRPGDMATVGITMGNGGKIDLNGGGSIKDVAGNLVDIAVALTFPDLSAVMVWAETTILQSVSASAGSYKQAVSVPLSATFSGAVTVTGIPRLILDVEGEVAYASFSGTAGTAGTEHSFTYTVGLGDDEDVQVRGIELARGVAIVDASSKAVANLESPLSIAGLVVDNTPPQVTGVANDSEILSSKTWNWGCSESGCSYRHIVDQNATTPEISGDYGDVATAEQASGNGVYYLHLQVMDAAGNESQVLHFSVELDDTAASVTEATPPAPKTYITGENLDFVVQFGEDVRVEGTPRLVLAVGVEEKYAPYLSGGGRRSLTFRYTVAAGDEDTDGIVLGNSNRIDLAGGSIKDAAGNVAVVSGLSFSGLDLVLVDGVRPSITGVTGTAGHYKANDVVSMTVVFSEEVQASGGTPRLAVELGGGTTAYAELTSAGETLSGELLFAYTVAVGDNDLDGIAVTGIDLNGATTIRDAGGNDMQTLGDSFPLADIIVDTQLPQVTNLVRGGDGSWSWGCNESGCQYRSAVNTQQNHQFASDEGYGSATSLAEPGSSGTYYVHVQAKDAAGNESPMASSNAFQVTLPGPGISSLEAPNNGAYRANQALEFTVIFDGPVAVDTTGGATPFLDFTIGGVSKQANYLRIAMGGPGVVFRYAIQQGDNGVVGGLTGSIDLNGGSIVGDGTNDPAVLTPAGVPETSGILVDTDLPGVSEVVGPTAGIYGSGDLSFTVTFDEDVTVSGVPSIPLTVGANTRQVSYQSGDGNGRNLVFLYTLQEDDNAPNGVALGSNIVLDSGASIVDAAGNPGNLNLVGILNFGNVKVDTLRPIVSGVMGPTAGSYVSGNLSFIVTFNEDVTVSGVPSIPLTVGANTRQASYRSGGRQWAESRLPLHPSGG